MVKMVIITHLPAAHIDSTVSLSHFLVEEKFWWRSTNVSLKDLQVTFVPIKSTQFCDCDL